MSTQTETQYFVVIVTGEEQLVVEVDVSDPVKEQALAALLHKVVEA